MAMKEGERHGEIKGEKKGQKKGEAKGKAEEKRNIVKEMYKNGIETDMIIKITNLSKEEIEKIIKEK